jgi:hypothetical protein
MLAGGGGVVVGEALGLEAVQWRLEQALRQRRGER